VTLAGGCPVTDPLLLPQQLSVSAPASPTALAAKPAVLAGRALDSQAAAAAAAVMSLGGMGAVVPQPGVSVSLRGPSLLSRFSPGPAA
jgi:hypothetical protein